MKKVFFLALAVLLSGCSKKDDIPEKVYMSGKWTLVNEQSITSGYIEFQEGKMVRYISSIGEVVAMEDALWHCSSSDLLKKASAHIIFRTNVYMWTESRQAEWSMMNFTSMTNFTVLSMTLKKSTM